MFMNRWKLRNEHNEIRAFIEKAKIVNVRPSAKED